MRFVGVCRKLPTMLYFEEERSGMGGAGTHSTPSNTPVRLNLCTVRSTALQCAVAEFMVGDRVRVRALMSRFVIVQDGRTESCRRSTIKGKQ